MHSVLTMVAGLGLFLFAMQQIEQAVQTLFSEKAAGWLRTRVREAVYALSSVKNVVDHMAAIRRSNEPGLKGLGVQVRVYLEALCGETEITLESQPVPWSSCWQSGE